MAEAKLAMSLDDIIKTRTGGGGERGGERGRSRGGRGRGGGARAKVQEQKQKPAPAGGGGGGGRQPQQQQQQRSGRQGGGGGGGGGGRAPLAVAQGAVRKRRGQPRGQRQPHPYDMDIEEDEYVEELPAVSRPPRGRAPLFAAGGGPKRGNPDGKWEHDMYRDEYVPPRRNAAAAPGPAGVAAGTRLIITNLDYNVSQDDMLELFSTCGTVLKHHINFDRSGRSLGTGEVVFSTKAEAAKARAEYNGIALDGKKMVIEFAGAGTAPFGGPGTGMPKTLSSGIRVGDAGNGAGRVFKQVLRETVPAGGGGGGFNRGAGGQRGQGGGRGGRLRSTVVRSRQELDAEMDDMMHD